MSEPSDTAPHAEFDVDVDLDDSVDLEILLEEEAFISSFSRGDTEPLTHASTLRLKLTDGRLGDYQLLRKIGEGGMGRVFEARDLRTEQRVALKMLFEVDAASVYRLKREFRRMVDIVHHNLVTLHELVLEGEACFFTMEYVEGVDLLRALEGELGPGYRRLREVLRQLTRGVHALHEAGRVHRDLKPHNVLVAADGRVVVLDFGLARDVSRQTVFTSVNNLIQGTPAYMSPEQAAGQLATPASDWYAVGVMLYELLAGRLPFVGGAWEMLTAKQVEEPPPLSRLCPEVDGELEALVMALLDRDPEQRPGPLEVLTWCAGAAGRPTLPGAAAWRPERPVLLDREEQLGEIQEALAEVSAGHPACVDIHGAPGTGKSALVRAFLEPLRAVAQVVILEARCSERESVPYRAFDGIIDGLAAALRSLTADQRWLLLGDLRQEFDALCQIFPVLRRADPEIERRGTAATGSSLVSRHHAFIGLKRLLHRLAQLSTLVVVIEELHRADADSVRLLVELLSPPDVPAMLLVCTYDTLPGQRVEVLADLEHFRAVVTSTYSLRILTTGALAERDAVELAVQLMGGRRIAKVVERAQAIAAEAEGNPLLISSLVRESDPLEPEERSDAGTLLRRVVDRRLAELHPAARELLALFMVSRGEIELELIRQAMPDHVDPRTLLTQLRGVRMLRISQRAGVLQVEAQHHQLHEAILDGIGEELIRESHRRLARAMRELEIEDSERVAHHLAHAGERHEAAEFAARAAHEAARSLAFDRAAELYCLAVECRPDHWAYCRRCADALVQAGRGTEAAEYYLAAAERAPAKALELRTAAAEQFLLGGHVEAGLEVARPLLERLGIGLPVEAEELDALFTEHVGRLVRRGLAFQERGELEVYSEELGVVDLLWALGRGLVLNDPVRGGYFLLRGVTKALDAGEPHRIARFLALVGLFTANFDPVRGLDAFAVAEAVAGSIRDEYAIGLVSICRGICHRDAGTWYVALSDLEFGVTHLRDHCDHAGWECSLALRSITGVLEALGELRTLEHRAQTFHQIAQESGDVLLGLLATMSSAFTLLAASSPGEARARVQHALHFWPRSGFHVQHLHALKIEALCDLHEGDAEGAWRRLGEAWPEIEHSNFLRLRTRRIDVLLLRARVGLALLSRRPELQPELQRVIEGDVAQLEAEPHTFTIGLTILLRAGLLALDGHSEQVLEYLDAAVISFEVHGMLLMAACASWCKGVWIGGREGRKLVRKAEAFMSMQGVAAPERWIELHAPGLVSVAADPS